MELKESQAMRFRAAVLLSVLTELGRAEKARGADMTTVLASMGEVAEAGVKKLYLPESKAMNLLNQARQKVYFQGNLKSTIIRAAVENMAIPTEFDWENAEGGAGLPEPMQANVSQMLEASNHFDESAEAVIAQVGTAVAEECLAALDSVLPKHFRVRLRPVTF